MEVPVPLVFKIVIVFVAMNTSVAVNVNSGDEYPSIFTPLRQPQPRNWQEDIRKNVIFQLYTRKNKEIPEIIDLNAMTQNISLPKYFDPKRPVRIGVHGWYSNGRKMSVVRKAFLDQGKYNYIFMNWRKVDNVFYPLARLKVIFLGQWLALFIDVLAVTYGLDVGDFHLIGHSMGAHISGVAGLHITGGRIGRITGLDPAGPLFRNTSDILSYRAAPFVDVIHTCGNILGYWDPLGHVDFYPNGGVCVQPGCHLNPWPSCSHNRAVDFFAESINNEVRFASWPFLGGPLGHFETNSNTSFMGNPVEKSTRGVYYLITSGQPPYAVTPLSSTSAHFKRDKDAMEINK